MLFFSLSFFLSVTNEKNISTMFLRFLHDLQISKTLNLSLLSWMSNTVFPRFLKFTCIVPVYNLFVVQENLYVKKTENFYERLSRICIVKKKGRTEGRSRGLSRNLQLSTSFAINFANLYLVG